MRILQPKTYANWVKRQFMEKRVLPRDIRPGSLYMFLYEDNTQVETGALQQAPIVAPLKYYNHGFIGLNIVTLPSRRIRTEVLEKYARLNAYTSDRVRFEEAVRLMRALQGNMMTKESLQFYKAKNIKTKIVQVNNEDVKQLIRRVL